MFSSIYKEILSEDEEQKNNEEEGPNFFAIKELMKLEYQLLTKTEDCFKAMVHEWSNSKENLAQVMDMMCYENVGLKYEAILQLSLFLLMPNRSDLILSLMKRNKQAIVTLLQGFELGKQADATFWSIFVSNLLFCLRIHIVYRKNSWFLG